MRVGFGYDSHVFGGDGPLRLGGVEFPGEPGLKGHSDADAPLHAIADALLGAAALGDIGRHFPDTDPRFAGADSSVLLGETARLVREAGWEVENVDCTVVCERPRIAPRVEEMVRRIADALGVGTGQVSVKGKTNERMDDVGAGRGVVAFAVASLRRGDA